MGGRTQRRRRRKRPGKKQARRPTDVPNSPASPLDCVKSGRERRSSKGEARTMAADRRFEGMGAIVTGGASGIGLAVARRIVAEGGEVLLWDVDQARLDAATAQLGAKSRGRRIDVVDPDEVEREAKGAEAAMGHVDALVCSAGVAGENALAIDYPIAEWKRVFDINVNGLFYCNRFVARLMKARGYGRIVNVASIAGKEGNPTASAYSASKAAVIGLTKSLGKELAKDGVSVNAITPATIQTA